MVRFTKNDRLDALITVARDEIFYFYLKIDPKGGPLEDLAKLSSSWLIQCSLN